MPVVTTSAGQVRGRRDGPIASFRGLPYAGAPVGRLRFAPPPQAPSWTGIRDSTSPGPTAPQSAARLERVMGPLRSDGGQGEDCLSLDIWTPGPAGAPRPVMVWLHGGGFSTGAGSAEWYSGRRLAERGELVVVNVNYRLGALGYLYLGGLADDMGTGNLGLLDMMSALRWVRENISAFGGDRSRVTVAGQSGGALSAVAMMAARDGSPLFHRAILQSAPLFMPPDTTDHGRYVADLFLRALDLTPKDVHRLRELPVARLLEAQRFVARATRSPLVLAPPFQLVADSETVAADPVLVAGGRTSDKIDVLIGCNRDEGDAFFVGNEQIEHMSRKDFRDALERSGHEAAELPDAATPLTQASAIVNDQFCQSQDRFVANRAANGGVVYSYRFDWRPQGSPFGACHCLELPFVFGNPPAWREAPMLPRGEQPMPTALVDLIQRAWISFVLTGDPGHDGAPNWTPHDNRHAAVMHLGLAPFVTTSSLEDFPTNQ